MGAHDEKVDNCFDCDQTSFVELMGELTSLNGYRAAAIITDDGELLYSNTVYRANDFDLPQLVKELNTVFLDTYRLTEQAGFHSCNELSLRTKREVVAIHCSGKDCLVGIRVFTLVESESNLAFVQRQLRNLLPKIMNCLTWNPDNLVPLYMRELKNRPAGTAAVN